MIRLRHRSHLHKLLGLLRFSFAKLYYRKRLGGPWLSTVDARCTLAIESRDAFIRLGSKCLINSDCFVYSNGKLSIGANSFLNSHTRIVCHEEIEIGANCLFGPFSSVLDHNHTVDFIDGQLKREQLETAPIRIGNNVWIGEKAIVLMGVSIGDNSVIGAGSVVTKTIPANSVAVGVPARVVRSLRQSDKPG